MWIFNSFSTVGRVGEQSSPEGVVLWPLFGVWQLWLRRKARPTFHYLKTQVLPGLCGWRIQPYEPASPTHAPVRSGSLAQPNDKIIRGWSECSLHFLNCDFSAVNTCADDCFGFVQTRYGGTRQSGRLGEERLRVLRYFGTVNQAGTSGFKAVVCTCKPSNCDKRARKAPGLVCGQTAHQGRLLLHT